MKPFTGKTIGLLVGALLIVPISGTSARADDDDDWEDRWEEYQEDLEDAREEAREDWEDAREEDEERWERDHRHGYGYRQYYYPEERYYGYQGGPVYRQHYYSQGRRVERYYGSYPRHYYGGHVHAGPVDVHYGRHGAVRVGPIQVYW